MRKTPAVLLVMVATLAATGWAQPIEDGDGDENGAQTVSVQPQAPQTGGGRTATGYGARPMVPNYGGRQMMQAYGGWQMSQAYGGWQAQPQWGWAQPQAGGRQPQPQPRPGAWAPQPQPQPGAVAGQTSGMEITDANWGFKFVLPQGWQCQKAPQNATLTNPAVQGGIFIARHSLASLQEMQAAMQQRMDDSGVVLYPSGQVQQLPGNILGVEVTGLVDETQLRGYIAGIAFPTGGGVFVAGLASPQAYTPQLQGIAQQVAQTVQPAQVQQTAGPSDLASHFAGVWVNQSKLGEAKVALGADGRYYENIEKVYSGTNTEGWTGTVTGNWDLDAGGQASGRWTVRGTREQGQIIVTYNSGEQMVVNYRVHVENGQTYWREYWFGDDLYGKQ